MKDLICFVISISIFITGCASVTLMKDTPEDLDGFLKLPWGLTVDVAQDQMLSMPHVTIDHTLTNGLNGVLVFRNVTFLDIPVDKCSLIFYEHGGLSDVQLRFLRSDATVSSLFDSLRSSMQREYGSGISENHRIEWVMRPLRRGYVRERRAVLALEPDGSLLLHAHADYAEIQYR